MFISFTMKETQSSHMGAHTQAGATLKNMLLNSITGQCKSNVEHTGKADNQTYKQTACQAVAKEVKSHFPWKPPSEYG